MRLKCGYELPRKGGLWKGRCSASMPARGAVDGGSSRCGSVALQVNSLSHRRMQPR